MKRKLWCRKYLVFKPHPHWWWQPFCCCLCQSRWRVLRLSIPEFPAEFYLLLHQGQTVVSSNSTVRPWELPAPTKLCATRTPPKRKLQRRTKSQHTVEWPHPGVLPCVVHKDTWTSKSDRHGPVPSWLWDLGMLLCTFSFWSRDHRADVCANLASK